MSDNTSEVTSKRWTFEKSLNIPTMLMILGMTTSAVLYVAKGWSEQDRRIDSSERKAETAMLEMKRLEAVQATQARDQAAQMSSIRSEVRTDLRDINSKLDTLLLNSAGARNHDLKQWSK